MELKIKCQNTTTSSDGSQYGKFVIEPLERGFGTTIGNALRRVLLSSLEGAAVSGLRIEGITHEFTSVPGIVEDVIETIRNHIQTIKTESTNQSFLPDIERYFESTMEIIKKRKEEKTSKFYDEISNV